MRVNYYKSRNISQRNVQLDEHIQWRASCEQLMTRSVQIIHSLFRSTDGHETSMFLSFASRMAYNIPLTAEEYATLKKNVYCKDFP
jgi:hypothetical protein